MKSTGYANSNLNSTKFSFWVSGMCSLLLISGCGGSDGPEKKPTAPVTGKLESDIEIDLSSLGLNFTDMESGQGTSVTVSADGTFSGEAVVGSNSVSLFGTPVEGADMHADASNTKINAAYWSIENSPWKVTVAEDGSSGVSLKIEKKLAGAGAGGGH